MFSHLALTVTNKTISPGSINGNENGNGDRNGRSGSRTKVGTIIGGVIGRLAIVSIVGAMLVVLCKRHAGKREALDTTEVTEYAPRHPPLTMYRRSSSSDYVPVDMPSDPEMAGFAGTGEGDMEAYSGTAISPSPDLCTKVQREVMWTGTHQLAPSESVTTSSNAILQTGWEAGRVSPLSPRGSISTTDVMGLRAEVENLRQVVHEIRAERLEAPPEYAE